MEDDIFADFEHTPAPRLAAFDGLNRVIQVSSFQKRFQPLCAVAISWPKMNGLKI